MRSWFIGVAEFAGPVGLERNAVEHVPSADDGDDAVLRRSLFGGGSHRAGKHVSDGRGRSGVYAMAAGLRKSQASQRASSRNAVVASVSALNVS
jgi:hypothetical protein